VPEETVDTPVSTDGEHFHLSTAALRGPPSPKTLRVEGRINEMTVTILIDSGSSHNIMQPRVAEFLQLPIDVIHQFVVTVGNGQTIPCQGYCSEVPVVMASHLFSIPFFVLPIHGADLVLGVQWLRSLGPFLSDYNIPSIQFVHNRQPVTIVGTQTPGPSHASLAQFNRFLFTDAVDSAHTVTLTHMESDSPLLPDTDNSTQPDIALLLQQFDVVFSVPHGLPPHRQQDHHIHLLPNTTPVNTKPYRYPQCQKEIMTKMIQQMLDDGIIRPSTSPFSSPVLLVRKKDGTWRFCVDYRALNAITVKDRFPIPTVDELLDELHGAKYFSKLDLRSGYHQILVAPDDTFKTAFRTIDGHFEFLVMPFGLSNAPSTFQATMNTVFRKVLRQFVLVFFDDILIYSKDWESHLLHLQEVLHILADHQLFAKMSKCQFGVSTVAYLGHIISSMGVSADPDKIHAIQHWPTPRSVSELRGFLGLTGYYRKFVHHYAGIAGPLTDLLKKQAFTWTTAAQASFDQLKDRMTTLPVLGIPNFGLPFDVTTDASGFAVGAVLSQTGHPLAFFSKKLCTRMQTASAYEREMFAITSAVKKWRHYLLGRRFRVYTDQQSLRGLISQTIQTPAQQKWLSKLLGYDYEILYTPGRSNVVADALSRKTEAPQALFTAITSCQPNLLQQLKTFYETHQVGQLLLTKALEGNSPLTVRNGLLYSKDRLFIPLETLLRPSIIHEMHATPTGGHSGVKGTLTRVAASFAWPRMAREVQDFVQQCTVCQQSKYSTQKQSGLLQPLPIPQQVWEDISMDFITHLPASHGKTTIWVIVDRLTKYAHFFALPPKFSAATVASLFLTEVYKLHGMPRTIVSDRDRLFISQFWKELFRLQGTTLAYSSSYHPQTDGQTEVTNRILETYLRCFVCDTPRLWVNFLALAEHWYNTTYQSAIRMTPFEALYGRAPPSIRSYTDSATNVASLDDLLRHRQQVMTILKANLGKAQSRMRSLADAHRQDRQFKVDDWVWLKLTPYRQNTVRPRCSPKLSSRFFGPFQITKVINTVAYELALPASARIHPVFHVSKLKPFKGQPPATIPELDPEVIGPLLEVQPLAVLSFRTVQHNSGPIRQALVHWSGLTPQEATWETVDSLLQRFPHFNLEDKVNSEERGNDTSQGDSNVEGIIGPRRGKRVTRKPAWQDDFHLPQVKK
jgi:hypothetical protein